ncbi:L-fucose isomerase [Caproiciproducens galactitolivorans]|uniref:L-fucose isomerase n=1 Tax=Caproiciproducens galactitolivorans TaxID=642589 RepID=A0A4Z0Y242_9FIRM|nr:L-fucose isomerase [Caproiciproducens galactitolivorans]QEY34439.1 L-fucose isomerase [Caproiciproducens galactitolivorans]TGJ77784.1 L-fucose isomerase [Caproiciproducens galactitolivorans]
MNYPKIGIRPVIDGRWGGIREGLEGQTMGMANAAKALIEENITYADGTPVQCVVSPCTIGGGAEAARCAEYFSGQNVCATLSVTPCWCYGSETMDLDPLTIKAVWGFNGTERPGAVYLAAAMAAHAQRGLPAFSIYGRDVQDMDDRSIPGDVAEKILRFARCAVTVGQMRNKAYVGLGAVAMGIAGSYCDAEFFQKYLGIRAEWVDMTEILRRIHLGIYDHKEYEKALAWTKANCKEGVDNNAHPSTREQKEKEWEFVVKMTLVCRDIMLGNEKLNEIGKHEEALGRNAILGGFQGQRMWTDWLPNGDFTEAILNSSFDWNGKRQPITLATENDGLNGTAMLFGKLLTGTACVFADVRTYWSPEAVKRVTDKNPTGMAANGFMHLINSGAAALDGTGACKNEQGKGVMKKWWDITDEDIRAMTEATDWCPANLGYFRGGGFSSHFKTQAEMPITLIRVNIIDGLGPVLQLAEGYTVVLPDEIHNKLDIRTDPTWPTTWFVPRLTGKGAFRDVYSVMANWGANHGAFAYGHIGKDLITLASMLRIPVSLHNVPDEDIYRPHSWSAFGTKDLEDADYRACATYGPLYK